MLLNPWMLMVSMLLLCARYPALLHPPLALLTPRPSYARAEKSYVWTLDAAVPIQASGSAKAARQAVRVYELALAAAAAISLCLA